MSIRCPHCEHKFALKAAAGVYQPKCPDCGETFALAIPREAGGKAIAAKTVEQLKRYQAKHSDKTAHPPAAPNANAASAADMPTVASSPADQPTVASAPVDMPTVATPPASAGAPYDQPTVGAGPAPAASETDGEPLARLDGYELLRELGRGGMGCVYLARQLSLDRHVAVKTIAPQLARSPAFLARFVREAFAVAQLSHHNVVQIHDVGHEDDQHYFSMEFVQGRSLSDIVKANGPLPPQQAVTYTLHAARGLAFAHEHQMVHRDVKPANLLLNDQGLVKVADLGLVKTADAEGTTKAELEQAKAMAGEAGDSAAGTHVTKGGAAMGTPAFMAPEQAKDAAAVDARADIYALGATLYYLLTGKPPLPARSADELLKLHATVGIKPPAARVPAVPEKLSAVVMKMLAKRPGDRFATMAEVVAQLEALMGVSAKAFTPAQQHADQLEHAVERYNQSAPAKVRRGGYIAFHIVALLLTAAGIILGNYILTGTTVWAWACTTAGYLLLSGMVNRGDLSRSVRQYLYQIGWVQWVMLAGGIASFTVMAVVLGLILYFLAATAVGLGLAAGYAFIVDRWVAKDRAPAVAQVRKVLRDMRLRGQDEKHIRRSLVSGVRKVSDEKGVEREIESTVQVVQNGAGQKWVRFAGFMDYALQVLVTPINDASVEVRFLYAHQPYAPDSFESMGMEAAIESTNGQRGLEGDLPIWHNKFHLRNPILCDGDGPIMRFRKYFAQFYVDGPYPGDEGLPVDIQHIREEGAQPHGE